MSAQHPLFPGNAPEVEAAFQAVPDEMVAEILDGELHTFPRPARPHTRTASRLGRRLGPFDDDPGEPGGWVILDEPELHLGPRPDKVVPDLAGWRRERMPDALGPEDAPAHYNVAPDWVCEVISPRTERVDRGKKMRIYRREGVRHAWLINPVAQTLEVYRLDDGPWSLLDTYEGDEIVRPEPFEAVELPLASLWAR
ncbi:Uma2 family endonuclease [Sorangium atrum]|uniref:Uma2 family endonuclease n=1 Tax=Sorangium atrum TaxID=2995308 RepID=A0ABT5BTM9_9BACT|nr:Uma2 family endonuclease [Sorangium aterium]MDC0676327.1 Uma2 family endonuclease [Sorangium aterium]